MSAAMLPGVAGLAAAAAVALVRPLPGRLPQIVGPGPSGPDLDRRALPLWAVPFAGAPVGLAVAGGSVELVVLGAVLTATGVAAYRLLRATRRRRLAAAISLRVLEACEAMAAELAVGRPPGAALESCAAEWPALAPVAAAFGVGADVPAAWRQVARQDGAGDLRVVAAAWQVAHRTGGGLADTLDRVARDLRAVGATRRVVAGELASARATARLVCGLPVLALAMGSGSGGDPWSFLLGDPVGLACLGLGLGFALTGLAWIEALARAVDR